MTTFAGKRAGKRPFPPTSLQSVASDTSHNTVNTAKPGPEPKLEPKPEPKQPCRVTVTESGWHGARAAAIAAGCTSVSDMIEKLGRGELSIITPDAIRQDPLGTASTQSFRATDSVIPTVVQSAVQPVVPPADLKGARQGAHPPPPVSPTPTVIPQHVHYHTTTAAAGPTADDSNQAETPPPRSLPKLVIAGLSTIAIVGSLLYIGDRFITLTANLFTRREAIEGSASPVTGDMVAGYVVSDEYGIRPVHPVTGALNAPHNGVDLAMPIGTPIHAVGRAGDIVEVKCWWDDGGGGQVMEHTAESYPGYIFQSLHLSESGCQEGTAQAGDVVAYSGNTGLGTGAHYDFRIKIDGAYIPPGVEYLESAVTGEPPRE